MSKHTALFALVSLLSLTACAPRDFVESPVAGAFFQNSVGDLKGSGVYSVYVCYYKGEPTATVSFNDDSLYTYRLQESPEKPVRLFNSTLEEREDMRKSHLQPDLGCMMRAEFEFEVKGLARTTWANLRGEPLIAGYVQKSIVVNNHFHDGMKAIFSQAALAVHEATKAHKAYVPPTDSWGIK